MAAKKSPAPADPNAAALPFEEALDRLEHIVEDLEGGSLTLEESLARYEEGIRLSKRLTQTLDDAEKRIEKLVADDGSGTPATSPMELDLKSGDPEGGGGQLPF